MCRTTYGDLILAARLSESVYEPETHVLNEIVRHGMTHVAHVENAGTFCTIAIDARNCMWLVFRGTQLSDLRNVNADRRFLPVKEDKGLAHRGFVQALEAVWLMVKQYCAEHRGRLIVTGHSLGAALAKLSGRRLGVARRKLNLSGPDVITFGCPLVGSPSWLRSFHWEIGDYIRVTNGGDPVPWLFAWPLYQHSNIERIHLDGEGGFECNPSRWSQLRNMPCGKFMGIVKFCQAYWQTGSLFRAWLKVTRVLDHGMHRYRGQLVDLFEDKSNETIA